MIDVGCGCGATTIALADVAGSAGRVLGVDIAAPMLARARQRVGNRPQVELVEADAATFLFDEDHDLVFSRFGVMFFGDPGAAFRNLARSLRGGGRLAFIRSTPSISRYSSGVTCPPPCSSPPTRVPWGAPCPGPTNARGLRFAAG